MKDLIDTLYDQQQQEGMVRLYYHNYFLSSSKNSRSDGLISRNVKIIVTQSAAKSDDNATDSWD
jgi:hypothetical protein